MKNHISFFLSHSRLSEAMGVDEKSILEKVLHAQKKINHDNCKQMTMTMVNTMSNTTDRTFFLDITFCVGQVNCPQLFMPVMTISNTMTNTMTNTMSNTTDRKNGHNSCQVNCPQLFMPAGNDGPSVKVLYNYNWIYKTNKNKL